jgi:Type I phosphodiesterase / nucleotide pyrophosphatase
VSGHVLVIGVDGVRFDALGPDQTPSLWSLRSTGFLTPVMIDDATPSWSGPCWATIATGVTVAEHNILHNDFTGHRLAEYPDFVTVATAAGLPTMVAVSGWPPLATSRDGGPLFAQATRREFVEPADRYDVAAWHEADAAIAALAAAALVSDPPARASFVYLGVVDIAGHAAGVDDTYRAAVRSSDERVGRLITAVRSRSGYRDEDWTIIVVTDHGHLAEGGHGGREPEVITAWAAGAGPGIYPVRPVTAHKQIAPLALACVGLRLSTAVAKVIGPVRERGEGTPGGDAPAERGDDAALLPAGDRAPGALGEDEPDDGSANVR